jgi:hypothetical protein
MLEALLMSFYSNHTMTNRNLHFGKSCPLLVLTICHLSLNGSIE